MKSFGRVLAALALVSALLAIVPAAHGEPTATGASRFAACVDSTHQGDLVLLVDESRSLRDSDPDQGRVAASDQLMRTLAEVGSKKGVAVDVRIDTFSTSYDTGAGWLTLNDQSLGTAMNQVAALAGKNSGTGTDYWLALEGARQVLAEKAGSGSRCQAILLFSDGALDVDRAAGENDYNFSPRPYDPSNRLRNSNDRAQANSKATDSLCRDGGLVDQLRSAGVILFGIGLQGRSLLNFDLMRGIVTGTSPSGKCGAIQSPVPGDFYSATSVGDLILAFSQVSSPGQISERDICQGDVCPEGAHSFVLDASIGRVEILATSSANPAPTIILVDPKGQKVSLAGSVGDGAQSLGLPSSKGTRTWLEPKSVSIVLEREGSVVWGGQWQVVFVDKTSASAGEKSKTSIRIIGDISPAWQNATDLATWRQGGDPVTLQPSLVDAAGHPIDPASLLGTISLTVTAQSAGGKSTTIATLDKSTVAQPISLKPDDFDLGSSVVSMSLDVSTQGVVDSAGRTVSGTKLATQRVDYPISVLAPLGYPTIKTTATFATIEGKGSAATDLALTGGGCVWLSDGSTKIVSSPDGVASIRIMSSANSESTCVKLTDKQPGALPLELSTDEAGNGGISGKFTVMMAPLEDLSKTREVQVTFQGSLRKPLNQQNFALAFGAAILLGPGIPLLLLYLFRYLMAARIPKLSLAVTVIPVTHVNGGLMRNGVRLVPLPEDVPRELLGGARALRSLPIDGGITLRTKSGLSPFATPYVVAEAAGTVGVSDAFSSPDPKTGFARLPVAVAGHWMLVQRNAQEADQATLYIITGPAVPFARRAELYESAGLHAAESFEAMGRISRPNGEDSSGTPDSFGIGGASEAPADPFSSLLAPDRFRPDTTFPPASSTPPSTAGSTDTGIGTSYNPFE